jgi:hypothetical protein
VFLRLSYGLDLQMRAFGLNEGVVDPDMDILIVAILTTLDDGMLLH